MEAINKLTNISPLGIWWWNNNEVEMPPLMDFAAKHGVTEIYWSAGFGRCHWCEKTATEFLYAAHEKGIAVYYLTGDWKWVHNNDELIRRLELFFAWQKSACADTRFAGVHLDIEPHQDPSWKDMSARNQLLQRYIDLKVCITDRYGRMDWDLPFWWRAEPSYWIKHRGEMKYLHEASILEADRVFVMSYRNTAKATYEVGQHYVDFAQKVGRPIFLSAQVGSEHKKSENKHVCFYHHGHEYMMHKLKLLREIVNYPAMGIAVHWIEEWYRMQSP